MKIAVLFVGEYRTFPYCRKTMGFLDQLGIDIDVYFHTWEITKLHNPPIGRHLNPNQPKTSRPVSEEEIVDLLKRPAVIKVSPLPSDKDGFLIMRKGWLMGFEMVKASGINYDYVYVLRPDLFFRKESSYFQDIPPGKYDNAIGFLPRPVGNSNIIADCDFFSTFLNIEKLLCDDVLSLDQTSEGIHRAWFDYVMSKGFDLTLLPFLYKEPHSIARFPINAQTTYQEVNANYWKLFHNILI